MLVILNLGDLLVGSLNLQLSDLYAYSLSLMPKELLLEVLNAKRLRFGILYPELSLGDLLEHEIPAGLSGEEALELLYLLQRVGFELLVLLGGE